MIKNKFNIGQKVKDIIHGIEFIINKIQLDDSDMIDEVIYTGESLPSWHFEKNLELAKEKKKVSLFAPIINHRSVYYTDHHYHSEKGVFSTQLNVVGFHEIVVDVDDDK